MLLLAFLICVSPTVLAQLEESPSEDDADSDLADLDLDIVRHLKTKRLDILIFGFVSLIVFVPTGSAQAPPAGENHTVQGKARFTHRSNQLIVANSHPYKAAYTAINI